MKYNSQILKSYFQTKGYSWFETGDYNLNIIGIRNLSTKNQITNKFDDILVLHYMISNIEQYHEFPITTEPGKYYSQNLLNNNGVAILVPNQYKGTWQIGLHQGKYEALVQRKPVKVYRDKNKDLIYDLNSEIIDEGLYGINIHHAGIDSQQIDKWSAGCQVFKRLTDFNIFMNICKKAQKIWGNSFTYTLIEL